MYDISLKSTETVSINIDSAGRVWNWNKENDSQYCHDTCYRGRSPQRPASKPCFEFLDLEIDRGCEPSVCCKAPYTIWGDGNLSSAIPLHRYNDIPAFLQGNPHIINGYRPRLPFSLCCKSLFVWSNETVNIWTHLVGCAIFSFFLVYDNFFGLPDVGGTYSDHIIITLGLLCFMFCLLCSAGYHLFNCHSERACNRWLSLDLAGISVGLIGCYLPGVHYAYYCKSIWRDVYLVTCTLLLCLVLLLQLSSRFLLWPWKRRVLLYILVASYGIIPTMHWVHLNGGMSSHIVMVFLPKVTVMYLLGAAAFWFYISKFPEKCFPGKFDYIGSSHQIWHILVLAAFCWWHQAGRSILEYRVGTPCLENY